eukprot:COSAG01_NODE_679_length_14296_cov_250.437575_9_plen_421_part_00
MHDSYGCSCRTRVWNSSRTPSEHSTQRAARQRGGGGCMPPRGIGLRLRTLHPLSLNMLRMQAALLCLAVMASKAAAQGTGECNLAVKAPEVMKVCCPAAAGGISGPGGGHRRSLQAVSCNLPSTCPSQACAAAFQSFYFSCASTLQKSMSSKFPAYMALNNACSQLVGAPKRCPTFQHKTNVDGTCEKKPKVCGAPVGIANGMWGYYAPTHVALYAKVDQAGSDDIADLRCAKGYQTNYMGLLDQTVQIRCTRWGWKPTVSNSVGGDIQWRKFSCVKDLRGLKFTQPLVTQMATSLDSAHTTLRLWVKLINGAANIFSVTGTHAAALSLPPAYQTPKVGKDVGGIDPMCECWPSICVRHASHTKLLYVAADVQFVPAAKYDSWLTIGMRDGDSKKKLGKIGCHLDHWSETSGIVANNCGM